MSAKDVLPETKQSKSRPVLKSTRFVTIPACRPSSVVGCAYGAPLAVWVPWMTRPGRVPGVDAFIFELISTEPRLNDRV